MTMYEQSQQSDWLQTELESMSSQADSPAKTSQSQETKQEYKTERAAAYGQSAPVLLGSFDPDTPSLKTSQTCLMESGELGLSEFSGTFPRSGMMRSGTVYQLPMLVPGTDGTESGLLPTPVASACKGAIRNRFFGSPTYRGNLQEYLRGSQGDPAYINPRLLELIMGYPESWTELDALEIR